MKIEFYINDKSDIPTVLRRLATSLTLKRIITVYIDNKEYNLNSYREKYLPNLRDVDGEI